MLYVLYGQDGFTLQQAIEEIRAGLGDREMIATNTTRLDGRTLTLSELRDNCDAAPFLSSHRLVIVDGLLGRFEASKGRPRSRKRATKSGTTLGEWERLADYVKQVPATTVLVLVDGEMKGQNPLLTELRPLAQVKTFPPLRGSALKAWIQQRVKEENGKITRQAVDLLAEFIGGDLWAMKSEIERLLLYCQKRPIGEDDVRKLTTYIQEASIFALVDAVAEGRRESAQHILHRLYDDGTEPMHILAMIHRQYRLIALARDLKPGLSRQQMQDNLGLKSSYPLDKTLNQAQLYDLAGVRRAYDKLVEADLAIKTGRYSDSLALELLVTELARLKS
jgi:DNA polymerase III subunit delta